MIPGVNPRQMQQMMRQMGMQQVDVPAEQVIIRTKDKDLIIENPQVAKVTMMGQQTWQITGAVVEQSRGLPAYEPSSDDIDAVVSQTGSSAEAAAQALRASKGDLAEAILSLSK